jgi:hypothetical protein
VTLAAVGSAITPTVTGLTFPLTPVGTGDVVVIEVISTTAADYATGLASSNVTWDASPLVAHTSLSANSVVSAVFKGKVTSAVLATVTVTMNTGTPTLRVGGLELSTTAGYSAVTLDTSGIVNSATTLCPSLTPAHGSGEAYLYFGFNAGSSTSGSTSGYTYGQDASGNGLCYDAACTSSAQQPAFGASDTISGIAVLLYEAASAAPFAQPGKVVPARTAPRKGSSAGSPGAPRQPRPSPFTQPGRPLRGVPARKPGTAAGSPGAPYTYVPPGIPAPFAQPGRAVPPHPAARKGTAEGSTGAPRVPWPSPFTQPDRGARGAAPRRAAAARGSGGAPWVPSLPPAPFAQPNRATAGRRAARKGSAAGSPAPLYTPLVQETSGSTTGTTLTLTFPNPTTVSNGVVIAVCGYQGGSVSGITLGGVAGKFTRAVAAGGSTNTEIWAYPIIGQSSATIVITTSVGGIIAWAYEVSKWVNLDVTAGNSGAGTSWSSGAAGTAVPYPHFTVGAGSTLASGALTPAAAGWSNEAAYTGVASGSGHASGVSGWRSSPAAGTFTYSGTSASASWGAVTAAFIAVPPPVSYNSIWCGYTFTEHAAAGYTGVSATVTLPSTLPSTPSGAIGSVWVGLGPAINQTGVYFLYNAAKTGGVETAPWSWWIPGAGERWDESAWPSGAGDSLTFSVQVINSANWVMTITNNTRSWTYSETMSVHATNLNSWNTAATTPFAPTTPTWNWPQNSAVVIIEKEGAALPDYGSIAVTGVTTTPAYTQAPEPVFCVNAAIDDYPGPFSMAAGAFTFYWAASS